jgi:hypothetical protein
VRRTRGAENQRT